MVDLRIAVHPEHTIETAHAIAHAVEDRIRREVDNVTRVFVHVEPGDRDLVHHCPECPPLAQSGPAT